MGVFKKRDRERKLFDFLRPATSSNGKVRYLVNGRAPGELVTSYSTRLFGVWLSVGTHKRLVVVAVYPLMNDAGWEMAVVLNVPAVIPTDCTETVTEIKIKDLKIAAAIEEFGIKPDRGYINWFQSEEIFKVLPKRCKKITDETLDYIFKFYHKVTDPTLVTALTFYARYHWTSVQLMSNTMSGAHLKLAKKYPTCPVLDWACVPAIWHPLIADNFQKKLGTMWTATMADVWEMGYDGLEKWLRENFDHNSHDFENSVKKVLHDVNAWFNYHIGMHRAAIQRETYNLPIPKLMFCKWKDRQPIRWYDYYMAIAATVSNCLKFDDHVDLATVF